ncbi:MAG: hypothetical protein HOW73_10495 [Polyangiaceae bacterium]|nr:hypothetical protein [Polyangiaceae bacterium]
MNPQGCDNRVRIVHPETIDQAVRALGRKGVALGGGTVVSRWVSEGTLPTCEALVDLGRIPALRGIRSHDGRFVIGAMTALSALSQCGGALADAAVAIGNPNIRHGGTVGGNIAGRFPGADLHAAALVLDAGVGVADSSSERTIPIERFLEVGLGSGELITELRFVDDPKYRTGYSKVGWRKASAKTIVAVAASFAFEGGVIQSPRIAVSGIAKSARRTPRAETLLQGSAPRAEVIAAVAREASQELPLEIREEPSGAGHVERSETGRGGSHEARFAEGERGKSEPSEQYRRAVVADELEQLLARLAGGAQKVAR